MINIFITLVMRKESVVASDKNPVDVIGVVLLVSISVNEVSKETCHSPLPFHASIESTPM